MCRDTKICQSVAHNSREEEKRNNATTVTWKSIELNFLEQLLSGPEEGYCF